MLVLFPPDLITLMSNKGIKGYGCSSSLFLSGGCLIVLILKELTGLREALVSSAQVCIVFLLFLLTSGLQR